MNSMIRIQAFPRMHVSLIGMNDDGYRINGGFGFSVSSPHLSMSFQENVRFEVVDQRVCGFSENERQRLISRIQQIADNCHFKIKYKGVIEEETVSPHIGFGSSTTIYLAFVEALFVLNNHEYSAAEIVRASNRGGTSGIGINTYFKGGFVFDVGVPKEGRPSFKPSSDYHNTHPLPLALLTSDLPDWKLGICVPGIPHKAEREESSFFEQNCPIRRCCAEQILYEVVYGLIPSIYELDFGVFCKSIDRLQECQWKLLERNQYGDDLRAVESVIREAGAKCVGMSSFGPLLYFFGDNIQKIIDNVSGVLPAARCIKTSFNNSGRVIIYD